MARTNAREVWVINPEGREVLGTRAATDVGAWRIFWMLTMKSTKPDGGWDSLNKFLWDRVTEGYTLSSAAPRQVLR